MQIGREKLRLAGVPDGHWFFTTPRRGNFDLVEDMCLEMDVLGLAVFAKIKIRAVAAAIAYTSDRPSIAAVTSDASMYDPLILSPALLNVV